MSKSRSFPGFANRYFFQSAPNRRVFYTFIHVCLRILAIITAKTAFFVRKTVRRLAQETLFFSARRAENVRMPPDFSPRSGNFPPGSRDFGALFPACSSIWCGGSPSYGMAKSKQKPPVADAPRALRRTGFPSRVHLSSKSGLPLASCPGGGARDSRISHRPPFRAQKTRFPGGAFDILAKRQKKFCPFSAPAFLC